MELSSTGRAHWEGSLIEGAGEASLDSGAAGPLPITWKARTEEHGGLTSPEELIAAAHASCFSMSLSSTLAKAGTPPQSLDTTATATFVTGAGITTMEIEVTGDVPDVSAEDFLAAAETAKANCPVSKALAGNVEISLVANLA